MERGGEVILPMTGIQITRQMIDDLAVKINAPYLSSKAMTSACIVLKKYVF